MQKTHTNAETGTAQVSLISIAREELNKFIKYYSDQKEKSVRGSTSYLINHERADALREFAGLFDLLTK
jgi:hypothetical protein